MRISDWSSDVCSSDLRMKARRIAPNERTYSTLIDGHLKQGLNDKATQLLKEMEGRRIVPSLPTLTSFIYANCKANALDASQRILEIGRASGRERVCQSV